MKFGNLSYLFFLWLIPALILFYIYSFRKKDKLIRQFCSSELIKKLMPNVSRKRQILKMGFLLVAITFLTIALIRPRWGYHWEDVKRVGVDIIVAIDVSRSMLAEDVKPNRLERAKREIQDLLKMLQGDRIGLVVFSGVSFVQCPLTLDYGAVRMFLDYISPDLIPVPGTAIGEAIKKSAEAFSKEEKKSKALILITDGEDHGGDPVEAAKEAKKTGVKIFTIGVGQEGGAPIPEEEGGGFKKDEAGNMILSKLDETALQKIALETGGSYVRSVTGDMDLEKIYSEDIKTKLEQKELKSTRHKKWEERFQWFILAALFFICGELFFKERVSKKRSQGV